MTVESQVYMRADARTGKFSSWTYEVHTHRRYGADSFSVTRTLRASPHPPRRQPYAWHVVGPRRVSAAIKHDVQHPRVTDSTRAYMAVLSQLWRERQNEPLPTARRSPGVPPTTRLRAKGRTPRLSHISAEPGSRHSLEPTMESLRRRLDALRGASDERRMLMFFPEQQVTYVADRSLPLVPDLANVMFHAGAYYIVPSVAAGAGLPPPAANFPPPPLAFPPANVGEELNVRAEILREVNSAYDQEAKLLSARELRRRNVAQEREVSRHNIAVEAESRAARLASDALKNRAANSQIATSAASVVQAQANAADARAKDLAQIAASAAAQAEANRHNLAVEAQVALDSANSHARAVQAANEIERHNRATEEQADRTETRNTWSKVASAVFGMPAHIPALVRAMDDHAASVLERKIKTAEAERAGLLSPPPGFLASHAYELGAAGAVAAVALTSNAPSVEFHGDELIRDIGAAAACAVDAISQASSRAADATARAVVASAPYVAPVLTASAAAATAAYVAEAAGQVHADIREELLQLRQGISVERFLNAYAPPTLKTAQQLACSKLIRSTYPDAEEADVAAAAREAVPFAIPTTASLKDCLLVHKTTGAYLCPTLGAERDLESAVRHALVSHALKLCHGRRSVFVNPPAWVCHANPRATSVFYSSTMFSPRNDPADRCPCGPSCDLMHAAVAAGTSFVAYPLAADVDWAFVDDLVLFDWEPMLKMSDFKDLISRHAHLRILSVFRYNPWAISSRRSDSLGATSHLLGDDLVTTLASGAGFSCPMKNWYAVCAPMSAGGYAITRETVVTCGEWVVTASQLSGSKCAVGWLPVQAHSVILLPDFVNGGHVPVERADLERLLSRCALTDGSLASVTKTAATAALTITLGGIQVSQKLALSPDHVRAVAVFCAAYTRSAALLDQQTLDGLSSPQSLAAQPPVYGTDASEAGFIGRAWQYLTDTKRLPTLDDVHSRSVSAMFGPRVKMTDFRQRFKVAWRTSTWVPAELLAPMTKRELKLLIRKATGWGHAAKIVLAYVLDNISERAKLGWCFALLALGACQQKAWGLTYLFKLLPAIPVWSGLASAVRCFRCYPIKKICSWAGTALSKIGVCISAEAWDSYVARADGLEAPPIPASGYTMFAAVTLITVAAAAYYIPKLRPSAPAGVETFVNEVGITPAPSTGDPVRLEGRPDPKVPPATVTDGFPVSVPVHLDLILGPKPESTVEDGRHYPTAADYAAVLRSGMEARVTRPLTAHPDWALDLRSVAHIATEFFKAEGRGHVVTPELVAPPTTDPVLQVCVQGLPMSAKSHAARSLITSRDAVVVPTRALQLEWASLTRARVMTFNTALTCRARQFHTVIIDEAYAFSAAHVLAISRIATKAVALGDGGQIGAIFDDMAGQTPYADEYFAVGRRISLVYSYLSPECISVYLAAGGTRKGYSGKYYAMGESVPHKACLASDHEPTDQASYVSLTQVAKGRLQGSGVAVAYTAHEAQGSRYQRAVVYLDNQQIVWSMAKGHAHLRVAVTRSANVTWLVDSVRTLAAIPGVSAGVNGSSQLSDYPWLAAHLVADIGDPLVQEYSHIISDIHVTPTPAQRGIIAITPLDRATIAALPRTGSYVVTKSRSATRITALSRNKVVFCRRIPGANFPTVGGPSSNAEFIGHSSTERARIALALANRDNIRPAHIVTHEDVMLHSFTEASEVRLPPAVSARVAEVSAVPIDAPLEARSGSWFNYANIIKRFNAHPDSRPLTREQVKLIENKLFKPPSERLAVTSPNFSKSAPQWLGAWRDMHDPGPAQRYSQSFAKNDAPKKTAAPGALPKQQGVTAAPPLIQQQFAAMVKQLTHWVVVNLRPNIQLDIGLREQDSAWLQCARYHGLVGEYDLESQDSTHAAGHVQFFLHVCRLAGIDDAILAALLDCRERDFPNVMGAGLTYFIRYALGSGAAWTLIANCLMMLTSLALDTDLSPRHVVFQKGDDGNTCPPLRFKPVPFFRVRYTKRVTIVPAFCSVSPGPVPIRKLNRMSIELSQFIPGDAASLDRLSVALGYLGEIDAIGIDRYAELHALAFGSTSERSMNLVSNFVTLTRFACTLVRSIIPPAPLPTRTVNPRSCCYWECLFALAGPIVAGSQLYRRVPNVPYEVAVRELRVHARVIEIRERYSPARLSQAINADPSPGVAFVFLDHVVARVSGASFAALQEKAPYTESLSG